MSIAAVMLSGGHSSRMGSNKAHVEVAGRPMSAWVADALTPATPIVVAGHTAVGEHRRVDDEPGSGPLAGLAAAAITLAGTVSGCIVVAIDQPWLRWETVEALTERFRNDAVVPVADGRRQVTCAVYPMDLVRRAADLADGGGGLQTLLDGASVDEVARSDWRRWGEDGRSWFSVDRPEDLERGFELYGEPGGGRR